ncbi:MAG: carbohydrate ABC transporter permease [Micromonosporaceae bacterium]
MTVAPVHAPELEAAEAPARTRSVARAPGRRSRVGRIVLHLSLAVIMIVWLVPAVGLFVNSFRPPAAVSSSGWWTALAPPYEFTFSNYTEVLSRQGLDTAFLNSLFITIPATVLVLAIAAFAAYAFAWMQFAGKDVIFVVMVGLLVVPLQVTLVPLLRLFAEVGIAGTFLAVWLAHTGFGLPFAIYLLRNYMGGLPREVFEAAAIDGAAPTTSFFRLALPMSAPVIAAMAIFQFLWVWNDLLVALVFIGPVPGNLPLTVLVSNLVNSLGGQWHLLTAAAFIMMVVPVAIFIALQRYFVRGITGGAVKG